MYICIHIYIYITNNYIEVEPQPGPSLNRKGRNYQRLAAWALGSLMMPLFLDLVCACHLLISTASFLLTALEPET